MLWWEAEEVWRPSHQSSKGSKLVIRRSRGNKLSGSNFHSQIYDLASRGLYSTETTPLTSPAKGYCKSHPSYTLSAITLPLPSHTNIPSDLSFFPHFLISYTCLLCSTWNNPLPSTSSCFLFPHCFLLVPLKASSQWPVHQPHCPLPIFHINLFSTFVSAAHLLNCLTVQLQSSWI